MKFLVGVQNTAVLSVFKTHNLSPSPIIWAVALSLDSKVLNPYQFPFKGIVFLSLKDVSKSFLFL